MCRFGHWCIQISVGCVAKVEYEFLMYSLHMYRTVVIKCFIRVMFPYRTLPVADVTISLSASVTEVDSDQRSRYVCWRISTYFMYMHVVLYMLCIILHMC